MVNYAELYLSMKSDMGKLYHLLETDQVAEAKEAAERLMVDAKLLLSVIRDYEREQDSLELQWRKNVRELPTAVSRGQGGKKVPVQRH